MIRFYFQKSMLDYPTLVAKYLRLIFFYNEYNAPNDFYDFS